jgi:hypothetical protein
MLCHLSEPWQTVAVSIYCFRFLFGVVSTPFVFFAPNMFVFGFSIVYTICPYVARLSLATFSEIDFLGELEVGFPSTRSHDQMFFHSLAISMATCIHLILNTK